MYNNGRFLTLTIKVIQALSAVVNAVVDKSTHVKANLETCGGDEQCEQCQ